MVETRWFWTGPLDLNTVSGRSAASATLAKFRHATAAGWLSGDFLNAHTDQFSTKATLVLTGSGASAGSFCVVFAGQTTADSRPGDDGYL